MMPHTATLTVLTEFLNPPEDSAIRWDPDFLGYVPVFESIDEEPVLTGFKQVAVWHLTSEMRVTFLGGEGDIQNWDDRSEAIDFDYYHRNSTAAEVTEGFAIVELGQGKPSSELLGEFTVKDKVRGERKRMCAREIRWTGLPTEMTADGKKTMRFKPNNDDVEPVAVLANLAMEPDPGEGLKHFAHYYEVVRDANGKEIDEAERVTISAATAETYDCIPPAPPGPQD